MEISHNMVGWFEIPVTEMGRAVKFYESVFEIKLKRQQFGPIDMAWFPFLEDAVGSPGALVHNTEFYKPSENGVLIYFTAFSGDLETELKRAETAGAKIIMPKKLISDEIGFMGLFRDTEGNRVALHSRK